MALSKAEKHLGDFLFSNFIKGIAFALPALLFLIGFFLFKGARASIATFGLKFLTTSVWDPVQSNFGALPVIFGTLASSLLALLFAAPISVGVALLLTDVMPRRPSKIIGFLIEMLAAIPSVVYGLWGIFVLAPWLRTSIEPVLIENLGFSPLFSGPPFGVGMLAAGLILAVMITPTIASVAREIFRAVPRMQKEGALAIGATRWEMMSLAVLKNTKSGIFGAIVLGFGRALGETMAVTMVIGNRAQISASLFAPGQTMSSVLANEYAEASSDMHLSALIEIGFVLFIITFFVNAAARFVIWYSEKRVNA